MTDIRIKQLCLENFKCHKSLRLNFEGGDASIYGDNASGKTSIYDALTWLLFGKDSAGNGEKNIEIKPLDATGEVKDHLAVTVVEAVLDVNGEEVSLRRTYREVWTTKRGSSQATYDGNTSEYYVDGVPCKRNAFQERVNGLVDEDTFRMLTSVSYFASQIGWQDRRAVLFKVAGVMDDGQIMATNDLFSPLAEGMGKLSLDDFKKKMLAEKRKLVGAKTEIPARISECQKTIEDVERLDFAGAREEMATLQTKQDSLAAQIVAIDHDAAADQKRLEIREAQMELNSLENENKAYRASQTSGNAGTAVFRSQITNHQILINDRRSSLVRLQTNLKSKNNALTFTESAVANSEKEITYSRERWMRVNAEAFTGGKCGMCGQTLPADLLQKAMEAFEASKKKRLTEIEIAANAHKASRDQGNKRIMDIRAEITELTEQIAAAEADIRTAEMGIEDAEDAIRKAEACRKEPSDLQDYAQRKMAINMRIEKLNEDLYEVLEAASGLKERLTMEQDAVSDQIQTCMEVISKESLLKYSRMRVDGLREDARHTAECLEAIEKMLFLIDEYSRYKTSFVEDSINGLFRIARFRLFREQANGGVEDRCDAVYDGIPYISVNNGMKINLGIDIINTLSVAYGVRVPLFVDNAESVTNLEKCGSQIIRLVVSENDKELRVKYES